MLFAILDYINYKRGRGIYDGKSIMEKGGRLAIAENFLGFQDFNPRHFLLLHQRDSVLSWTVMYFTASEWSHVANFTENGCILDATTSGIIEHSFSDYFDGKSYILIKMVKGMTDEGAAKAITWARKQIGRPFGWHQVFSIFWGVVFGTHDCYRIRVSADVLILLLLFSPLVYLSRSFGVFLACLSVVYILVVFINTPKRNKMRRLKAKGPGGPTN